MNTAHPDTSDSPALLLGGAIRQARQRCGLTIAELAEDIGRPREWLNRTELGYSDYGEHKPPSVSDLESILAVLGDKLETPAKQLFEWRKQAEVGFSTFRRGTRRKRVATGKMIQAELIIGEEPVVQAVVDLVNEQHSEAIIRNTGIKSLGTYQKLTQSWIRYREALGHFLAKNPNGLFKRVEFVATPDQLDMANEADRMLDIRPTNEVHNAKVKFHKDNPLVVHALIGQREAILALPQHSGQAGSSIALLVRDKLFVEALRTWYDEVVWEGGGDSRMVNYADYDGSFDAVRHMYGFEDKPAAK